MSHTQAKWRNCKLYYFDVAQVQTLGDHGNCWHPIGEQDLGVANWLTASYPWPCQ